MSNLIKKLFLFLLLFFSPTFLFAAPNITINNPSSDVSTENAVPFDVSIVDSLPTYGFVDWDDSLVGWWRAEGNANDESPYANHGTFVGDAHIVDNGKFGKAFSLDGAGDVVDIGDKDGFDFHHTDSFTISVWVYKADISERGILSKGRSFTLHYNGYRWQFTLDGHYVYVDEQNPQDRWIHLAVVYDASVPSLSMYVDGQYKAGGTVNGITDFSNTNHLGIGMGKYGGIEHKGLIDEVVIFKRALLESEIKALYGITGNSFITTYAELTEYTTHTYQLHVVNSNAERTDTAAEEIFIDVPNTPPKVILEYPLDNTRVNSPEQTFRCRVFNTNRDTQLQRVTFYWDYPGGFTADETKYVSGDTAIVEFTKKNLTEKTFQWNCYAVDTHANGGFAPENFTYIVGRDEYYVATDGNDNNPGTIEQPFRTVQKAADIAQPGDTIYIRTGTYRETIIPASSGNSFAPITFKAYPGEKAVISGADIIDTPWSLDKGFIYKTTMAWDMGKGNNQIFVDGEALIEARWPNTDDISQPTFINISEGSYSGQTAVIHSADVVQGAGFWNGAVVHAIWGARYHAITGEVTSSLPGTLELNLHSRAYWDITYGIFYITCSYNALDKPGEWFYDSSNTTLYLWMPGNDVSLSHTIEAKKRNVAVNLNGRSYITIEGLHIFSANITTDANSHHILIDNCVMKYINHYTIIDQGGMGTGEKGNLDTGIILDGHDNIIQNSEIAYSAGNGVALLGSNSTVHNCKIHDVNYVVTECAAVYLSGKKTENNKITYSKLYNSGRGLIAHGNAENLKILHNEMYNTRYGWEAWDLGATYAIATDGKGTEIAYNYIHDIRSMGIYLDNYNHNFNVHHNVIWNFLIGGKYGIHMDSPSGNKVYHNTVVNGCISHNTSPTIEGTEIRNNICTYLRKPSSTSVLMTNNIETNTIDPLFVDKTNANFHLQAASPAIDAGVDVGFPYIGNAPDIGAYEYGTVNHAPVAIFTAQQRKKTLSSYEVIFKAMQSYDEDGIIVNYRWDFGDGTIIEGSDKSYVVREYTSTGEYKVTLTVTDDSGNTSSQTQIVRIGNPADDDYVNEFELYALNPHGALCKNETLEIRGKGIPGSSFSGIRMLDGQRHQLDIDVSAYMSIDSEGNISGNIPITEIIKKYPLITSINVEVILLSGSTQLKAQTGIIMLAPYETELGCYNNIINPSKGITEAIIHAELAESAHCSIVIYDTQGREVKVVMDDDKGPGTYVIRWDATKDGGGKVGSGIYLIHMKAGGYTKTKKIAVIK